MNAEKKKGKRVAFYNEYTRCALEPVAPRWAVLLEAVAAIHWSALSGFEWNFAFLSTVGTNSLVCFARRPVVTHRFTSVSFF